jgi:hypothetical protein
MTPILKADDRLAAELSEKTHPSHNGPRITWRFNLGLLAFESILGILKFSIFSGRFYGTSPLEILFSSSLDLFRVVILVSLSAWFVKAFWTRFVSSVAGLGPIFYREAVAVVLMIRLLFGS